MSVSNPVRFITLYQGERAISTIIVITPPPQDPARSADEDETIIKVKLEGDGSISNLLREAADILDGHG